MMDTIYSRKSIRSYTGEAVSEDALKEILKAANAAPVGMGKYNEMHLTVITNQEFLKKIDATGAAMFGRPDVHLLYEAPGFVLVSAKTPDAMSANVTYSNAAIVAHNMALAATELGVGVCHIWGAVTAISRSDLVKELGLPDGFTPCCGVVLGKTDEEYSVREIPDRIAVNVID